MEFLKKLFRTKGQRVKDANYVAFSNTIQRPLVADLTPEQRKLIYTQCLVFLKDEVFNRIYDDLIREKAEDIVQNVEDSMQLLCKRHRMLGVDDFYKKVKEYAGQVEKTEEHDPYETI